MHLLLNGVTTRFKTAVLLTLVFGLMSGAKATTLYLNFVTGPSSDIFAVGTTTANFTPYGFTGMTTLQIQQAILAAVQQDFLGYPTVGADPSSPLPNGKQLDIDFLLASDPSNGDPEFYHLNIGGNTTGDTFLGQACFECIRNSLGGGPSVSNGAIIGSILVNNIAALAGLATTDAERINLLAGTVSHEAGHAVSLPHPPGAQANPGASTFSIMGTGAAPTNMPNGERVKDRAFAYSEMSQLMTALGTRDFDTVPEPSGLILMSSGLLLIGFRMRRARR